MAKLLSQKFYDTMKKLEPRYPTKVALLLPALHAAQEANDTMMAFQALRRAYNVDVAPILAKARMEAGGAIDVLEAYRLSQYRGRKAQERKAVGLGAGIV